MDGKEIRRVRKHLRLTQAQWAKVCKVRRQTVSEWENSDGDIDGPVCALAVLLRNKPARIVELLPEMREPMPPVDGETQGIDSMKDEIEEKETAE
jgi:DNA-binding XRE family transcriptional regulator